MEQAHGILLLSGGRGQTASNGRRARAPVEAAEPFTVLVEVAAQLADPCGAEAVPGANLQGALPPHQVLGQAAVSLRTGLQPGGEVTTERDLFGRRRLGVV